MRNLFLLALSLLCLAGTASADSYYDVRNGKRYLCTQVSDANPLPSCTSSCQHYDSHNQECRYETSCEYTGRCLRERVCDVYDSFDQACITEKTTTTCATDWGSQISCVSQCQHYDSFNKECRYQTSCTIQGNCIVEKRCDRWDSFDQVCKAEKTTTRCQ